MNAVQLLTEHLAIWTGADNEKKSGRGRASGSAASVYGVKKLRELILELAVRGKLVPQDASDEPASELLKRIETEKAKLIKERKIKAQKPLAEIGEDEKPFDLPKGWEWVRLNEVGHDWGQKIPNQEFTYIDVGSINKELGLIDNPSIVQATDAPSRARKIVKNGTVIYSTVRPYLLNIAVIEQDFEPEPIASTAFAIVHPFSLIVGRFLFWYLRCPVFIRYVESCQTGIAYPAINDKQFFSGLMPLPPLTEQHRIVAKVDELMTLCDQLENQHSNAIVAHEKLVSYLLNSLTQSQDAAEFNESWQRIAANFDTLFCTESSIDALKQTVLQLAVMGKLVPQDVNDEPIDKLWTRIKKHEIERVKKKEIQKPKNVDEANEPEIQIPSSWTFYLLNDLAFVTKLAGFEYTEHMALVDFGEVPVIRAQNVRPFKPEISNLKYIDLKTSLHLQRCSLDRPALLMTFIGAGIGDVCAFYPERRWHLAPNVAKIEPFADTSLDYLVLYLNSPDGKKELFKSMKSTAQPSLSMTTIREIWISLPPLPEQHRIVAKVDELMAICDKLKTRITAANQLQQKMADVMVAQAVA